MHIKLQIPVITVVINSFLGQSYYKEQVLCTYPHQYRK